MGDPRKQRRKYETPKHPWRSERITEENELCKKYGLKNKRELWKSKSVIGRFREQARTLLGSAGSETKKEAQELIERLNKLGIMKGKSLEDVLALTVENLLDRRLQTVVYNMDLANTPKQARQLITHKHVVVVDNVVDIPQYTVPEKEENKIRLVKEIKVIKSGRKKRAEEGDEE